jgi:hypothetical protein
MYRYASLLACLLAVLLLSVSELSAQPTTGHEEGDELHAAEAHAEDGHAAHGKSYPHHWIGIFGGAATETGREGHGDASHEEGHGDEESTHTAGAVGLEYYLSFSPRLGAGVLVEHLGSRIDRNYTVFLPLGYHPSPRWRLVLAPGMEFTQDNEEWALRLGLNHLIPLGSRWELSPEFDVDFIEGGKITYVYGVMVGFLL